MTQEQTKFKRENRYVVFKVKNLTTDQLQKLYEVHCELSKEKQMGECVVVEHDWPNYQHVWDTIEQVANGTWPTTQAQAAGGSMKDSKFLEWIRDRLVHVYGENPNVDFVQRLGEIAAHRSPHIWRGPPPVNRQDLIELLISTRTQSEGVTADLIIKLLGAKSAQPQPQVLELLQRFVENKAVREELPHTCEMADEAIAAAQGEE